MDWSKYPNFSAREFNCKHTGRNRMEPNFMARLQALRAEYGKPMVVTSGYRDPSHPVEARKARPGTHALGRAVDIACNGADAYQLMRLAMKHGFTGIGVAKTFVHLDDCQPADGFSRPFVWVY